MFVLNNQEDVNLINKITGSFYKIGDTIIISKSISDSRQQMRRYYFSFIDKIYYNKDIRNKVMPDDVTKLLYIVYKTLLQFNPNDTNFSLVKKTHKELWIMFFKSIISERFSVSYKNLSKDGWIEMLNKTLEYLKCDLDIDVDELLSI